MVLGEVAAAAAVTGSSVFGYNRSNYMFDREQRQKQEFKTLGMRLIQADVWREDVRDMVGLTEKKMDVYIVVAALHVGFNLALYTEGRLEMGTPEWLIWLYGVALTGSFMFQLLAIWLALHASVVANGSEARLLTQFVRPPLPSWEQVESMRTYAASFEGVSTTSMFRVPVMQTFAEGFSGGPGGHAKSLGKDEEREATDPWGLERRGDDIYELQREALPARRHAKLVKAAARQWLAYDAFARASMTLGTILQCNAISYFLLGYVLVQDGSPWAAWIAVASLLGVASMLLRLDVSMTKVENAIAQILLFGGPMLACVAATDWAMYQDWAHQATLVVLPFAYLSHALFILFFLRLCQVSAQPGGAFLPTAFRSVVYLDIFGWLRRGKISNAGLAKARASSSQGQARKRSSANSTCRRRGSGEDSDSPSAPASFSQSVKRRATAVVQSLLGSPSNRFVSDDDRRLSVVHGQTFPRHFGAEDPKPLRPEDVETVVHPPSDPYGFAWAREEATGQLDMEDLSGNEGAEGLLGVGPPGVVPQATDHAFQAASWVPGSGGKAWATGRDAYDAGELPWYLFRNGAWVLALCWLSGAAWSVAQLLKVPDIPDSVLPEEVAISEEHEGMRANGPEVVSLAGSDYQDMGPPQRVLIDWPSESFQPWGISSDSTGTHFAISDEFQLYSASIAASVDGLRLTGFRPAPRCLAVEGQALRDIAVVCEKLGWDQGAASSSHPCKALVLHERGQRLAECDLLQSGGGASASVSATADKVAAVGGGLPASTAASPATLITPAAVASESVPSGQQRVWNISTTWLRALDGHMREEVISAAIDTECSKERGSPELSSTGACVVVGTNHGRSVRLRKHVRQDDELVPAGALWNDLGEAVKPQLAEVWATSLLQTLPGGYLLALRDGRRAVHVMHMASRRIVGKWRLPERPGHTWTALAGGTDHLFITSQDDAGEPAELWRFRLPPALKKGDATAADAATAE